MRLSAGWIAVLALALAAGASGAAAGPPTVSLAGRPPALEERQAWIC